MGINLDWEILSSVGRILMHSLFITRKQTRMLLLSQVMLIRSQHRFAQQKQNVYGSQKRPHKN
ncbi:hypothetical protein CHH93_11825, partial [Bacillus licheniformis]